MHIENHQHLFTVYAGLVASGGEGYDHSNDEIMELVDQIHAARFEADWVDWFAYARTGQVAVNSYWPRGSYLAMASFFIDQNFQFDANAFYTLLNSAGGVSDPVGLDAFTTWIDMLPHALSTLEMHPAMPGVWNRYVRIVDNRSAVWAGMIEKAICASREFFVLGAPVMSFNPNLLMCYSCDFVRIDRRIITLASEPDPETMLHETLHTAVANHRDVILAFAEHYGLAQFADESKMTEFGYMEDQSPASVAHVIEECFVRALAVILSGGSERRLKTHAEYGCDSVPFIASKAKQCKPTALTLLSFIYDVLTDMQNGLGN